MGRATRWWKNFWGGKKGSSEAGDFSGCLSEDRRERKRWSFTKSARDSGEAVVLGENAKTAAAVEAAWFRSFYAENEEQSKHAIAVAAATAAAADAAVAAAQAAVAVVRLTNQGRTSAMESNTPFRAPNERKTAALKIQAAFRGYLAKKALRALKSLVKLQALVRGYLVRKQAAATIHSMEALFRAQAAVRAQRSRHTLPSDLRILTEFQHRRSLERFDDARSEQMSSVHSRRLTPSIDSASSVYDRSPKIVEIDTCRPPKSRTVRRTSPPILDHSSDTYQDSISSPRPYQTPARISIPDARNFHDYDWCLTGDKCRLSATAQSTPRYLNSATNMPVTPSKSVSGADGVLRHHPKYMANTQSFEAKVRSQSAPKQRPEPAGVRKRLPLTEMMLQSRASLSGVGMQKSCSKVQEAFNFKSAVIERLDRSMELGRETQRDFYVNDKW